MTAKKVYVTLSQFCEQDERPRQILKEAGFNVEENKTGRRIKKEEMFDALKDADAVLAAVEPYDADLLQKLPRLQCISRCGVGTDAIDLEAAKTFSKKVLNTADEIVEPVAQMTLGMILSLARNFNLHASDFSKGEWKKHNGFLLSDWKIGLIGFGRIAKKVAHYLNMLGASLWAHDPNLSADAFPSYVNAVDFKTLLQTADLVSLHLSRPPQAGILMGPHEFEQMKRGSYFINTARGYMVDEKALLSALENRHLAGAALDVFDQEPYAGPLAALPNVICTPHVATLTKGSRIAMEIRCAQNVVDFFKGQK